MTSVLYKYITVFYSEPGFKVEWIKLHVTIRSMNVLMFECFDGGHIFYAVFAGIMTEHKVIHFLHWEMK